MSTNIGSSEEQSDDLASPRIELGYQTFCKPNKNNSSWIMPKNIPKESTRTKSMQVEVSSTSIVARAPNNSNMSSVTASPEVEAKAHSNIFIIKSQAKKNIKPVTKLNKILTLDPIGFESSPVNSTKFFIEEQPRSRTTTNAQRKKVEFDVPIRPKQTLGSNYTNHTFKNLMAQHDVGYLDDASSQYFDKAIKDPKTQNTSMISRPKGNPTKSSYKRTYTINSNVQERPSEIIQTITHHNSISLAAIRTLEEVPARYTDIKASSPIPRSSISPTNITPSKMSICTNFINYRNFHEKSINVRRPNEKETELKNNLICNKILSSNSVVHAKGDSFTINKSKQFIYNKTISPRAKNLSLIGHFPANKMKNCAELSPEFIKEAPVSAHQSLEAIDMTPKAFNSDYVHERKKSSLLNKAQTNLLKKIFAFDPNY